MSAPPTVIATRHAEGHDDLASLAALEDASDPGVAVSETDDVEILYTSGTTGWPKGVLFDHHGVLWVGRTTNLAATEAGPGGVYRRPEDVARKPGAAAPRSSTPRPGWSTTPAATWTRVRPAS